MFTKNVKRGRGRPPGETAQGAATRQQLYDTAVEMIAEHGYEATTLRAVAARAGVSPGLLYRYFPNKRAVILALYDQLSSDFAHQATAMPAGKWRDRFWFALESSLHTLTPHRGTLQALTPVLVGDPQEGLFAEATAFSRLRVQAIFQAVVVESTDAPARDLADALGRLLYLAHLGVLLWWLLDKSPKQRATTGLVALMLQMMRMIAPTLRLPPVRTLLRSADDLVRDALLARVSEAPG